jgi:recombination protein RecA
MSAAWPRCTAKRWKSRVTSAQEIIDGINQKFGAGTLVRASTAGKVEYLSTGLAPIDDLLMGGIPYGRSTMIHGDYSTLKSYIALCAIAQCQRQGKIAALIDTEGSFDADWARSLGVDTDLLIMPDKAHIETGEKCIDVAEILIRNGVDLMVFDSVAAMLPKAEHEKSMDEGGQMLRQAAFLSKALRKITAANKKTALLWINQTRVNPGIMFGNNEAIPGGKALPYYCTYILGLYKGTQLKEDYQIVVNNAEGMPTKKNIKKTVGFQIRALLYKSKLNQPGREETFTYSVKHGAVDDWSYLANKALGLGLLGYERGKWWTPEDSKKMPVSQFRGHLPVAELTKMLHGNVEGVDSAGSAPQGSKKAAAQKPRSSRATTPARTRTPAPVASSSTARTRSSSSKSKTPSRVTPSASRTSASSARKPRARASKASS